MVPDPHKTTIQSPGLGIRPGLECSVRADRGCRLARMEKGRRGGSEEGPCSIRIAACAKFGLVSVVFWRSASGLGAG